MANQVNQANEQHKAERPHEGPKRHIVAFIASLLFTAFAFGAVMYAGSSKFIIPFIIVLAIIQALFQLYIWMHMDQKNHEIPALGIYTGALFTLAIVIVFSYWMGGY